MTTLPGPLEGELWIFCAPANEWTPGRIQRSYDKQFVRDWSMTTGWDKTAPAPEVPDEVVDATRALYVQAYEQLTGDKWR